MNLSFHIFAICVAVLLSSCTHDLKPVAPHEAKLRAEDPISLSPDESKRLGLSTQIAVTKVLPLNLETAGVVKADTTMTMPVLSLVPARAEEVFVQIGSQVSAGQKLATVRSDEVARIEADLLQKLIDLEADELQLKVKEKLAQKTYDRKKLLLQEKIAAKADVETAESDLQEARTALQSSEVKKQGYLSATKQRLKLFGISGDQVEKVANTKSIDHMFVIRAPRSGIVTERDIDPGEAVEPDKMLFTISDLHKVWIVAHVFERNIEQIKLGMPAEAAVAGYPEQKFSGHINFIDTHVDPENRTIPVRATIANPDMKLKPEMFAKLTLRTGMVNGLFVPEQAIQKLGEADIVYVETVPDSYREHKVQVGARLGGNAQILSGLNAGERVVVNGSVRLLGKVVQRLSQ